MKYIFDGLKVPAVKVPEPHERFLKILLSPEIGNANDFTLLYSIISPKNGTGGHSHNCDEVMCVITGAGEGEVEEQKTKLSEGTIIFAPKGTKHEITNTGDETLKLVCFFLPPLQPSGYFEEAITTAKKYFSSL